MCQIMCLFFMLLVSVVYSNPKLGVFGSPYPGYKTEIYDPPQYSFNYGVADHTTGDVKSQHERRDGDVVQGQYSLVEPDGSVRTVDYTADPVHGFNAVVSKSGPNVHAAQAPAQAQRPSAPVSPQIQPVIHYVKQIPVPVEVPKHVYPEQLYPQPGPFFYSKVGPMPFPEFDGYEFEGPYPPPTFNNFY